MPDLVWAFALNDDKLDLARQWFAEMQQSQLPAFHDFQKRIQQQRYLAWLQTSEQGNFIVEYAQYQHYDPHQVMDYVKNKTDDFIEYCLHWKKKIHGDQFDRFKGIRHLITEENETHKKPQAPLATVLPISPGKLSYIVKTIDSWLRHQNADLQDFLKKSGIDKWQAWIADFDEQQYLVQYHLLEQPLLQFYHSQQSTFCKDLKAFFKQGFALDLDQPQQLPHTELMIDVINPDYAGMFIDEK